MDILLKIQSYEKAKHASTILVMAWKMGGFGVQSSSIKVVMSKIRSWDSLEWKLKPFFSASFGSMDTKVDGRDPILNGVDFDRNLIGGKNRWCINFDQLYYYRNHCSDLNLHCTFFYLFTDTFDKKTQMSTLSTLYLVVVCW